MSDHSSAWHKAYGASRNSEGLGLLVAETRAIGVRGGMALWKALT